MHPFLLCNSILESHTIFLSFLLFQNGVTPLLKACQLRNYVVQNLLLENGANVNICDDVSLGITTTTTTTTTTTIIIIIIIILIKVVIMMVMSFMLMMKFMLPVHKKKKFKLSIIMYFSIVI